MSDDELTQEFNDTHIEYWYAHIDAPARVVDALWVDHQEKIALVLDSIASFQGAMSRAQHVWHETPLRKTYETVGKLSTGFAISPERIAHRFDMAKYNNLNVVDQWLRDKKYFHKDIIDSLIAPDEPPESYPTSITYFACHFLNAISEYLTPKFWTENPELHKVFEDAEAKTIFIFEDESRGVTPLQSLLEAQEMSETMKLLCTELKANQFHNLAVIADHFGQKAQTISQDIIMRVENAIDREHPLALHERAPSEP